MSYHSDSSSSLSSASGDTLFSSDSEFFCSVSPVTGDISSDAAADFSSALLSSFPTLTISSVLFISWVSGFS